MDKFKIGDKVRRIKVSWGAMEVGDVGTIEDVKGTTVLLKEWKEKPNDPEHGFNWHSACSLELLEGFQSYTPPGATTVKTKIFTLPEGVVVDRSSICLHNNTKVVKMIYSSYKECVDCGKDLGNV